MVPKAMKLRGVLKAREAMQGPSPGTQGGEQVGSLGKHRQVGPRGKDTGLWRVGEGGR